MMMPEPGKVYFDTLEEHIEQLKAELAAIARYLDKAAPGWRNADASDDDTPDSAPEYLWRDQIVTYVSPIKTEGEALAWVRVGAGEPIIVSVRELKPIKDGA
jgi:hypothetical protein